MPRGRYTEEAPSKSGSAVGVIILVLVLLAGAGAGGWWWYNNRSNPKDQAIKVFNAYFKNQDWNAAYQLTALSDSDRKKFPSGDSIKAEFMKNPAAQAGFSQLSSAITGVTAGSPTINGDKADVPLSSTLKSPMGGMEVKLNGTAHLIKQGSIWKLDLTTGTELEQTQRFMDMLSTDIGKMMKNLGGSGGMSGFGGLGGGQ